MAKVLLIHSGLKHTQDTVEPFFKRLEVHLQNHCDCLDVRNILTFDERTFFEYDQVIFIFSIAMNCIPSSTLEIFEKLENHPKNKNTEVYALIACDEFEPEKCQLSEMVMKRWCEKENLQFKGSLKIGSHLFIMKTISRYVVANYIKTFVEAIIKHKNVQLQVTMLTDRIFMKTANKYWNKEIQKKQKQKMKDVI